ncbi:MAG: hypothetical protein JWN25_2191 [Verrucomicrobiales bacterium]|nr:hypothetical protein [Verrucomicrobiales bacterium]
MGTHIMKTTIEIADDLFERARGLAKREKKTFRAITEEGLRLVLKEKQKKVSKVLPPLVTYGGTGMTEEFRDWNWNKILEETYRGRGT